jgi:glycine cleavage system transcriptional repressor
MALLDSGEFTLVGADNPGIVHTITSALAKAGLSIDRLHTDQEIAPYGGSTLFKMKGVAIAIAPLPKSFDIQKIKNDLMDLGDSLNCDVTIEDTVDDSYQGSFYAG